MQAFFLSNTTQDADRYSCSIFQYKYYFSHQTMSSASPRRKSHRVYLQQFIAIGSSNSSSILNSPESSINTTSAAIRLTHAATCQDVTQLLRQKFGLRALNTPMKANTGTRTGTDVCVDPRAGNMKQSGSISALDRINARLEHIRKSNSSSSIKSKDTNSENISKNHKRSTRKRERRIYDRSKEDALVVVASCFVPRGYLRFEHESSNDHARYRTHGHGQGHGQGHGHGSLNNTATRSSMNQDQYRTNHHNQYLHENPVEIELEPFNLFRTLLPQENALEVKNDMWSRAQRLQEEAMALFGDLEQDESLSVIDSDTTGTIATTGTGRRDRVRGKPPILRIFFVPCHDNGVPSNATIDIEGYCTDVDVDSDDDKNDNDNLYIHDEKETRNGTHEQDLHSTYKYTAANSKKSKWKEELKIYQYNTEQPYQIPQEQKRLVQERHRFAVLSGLEASLGDGCVSGYLFRLNERDSNVWKRFHCVLPNNQQFWFVSRVKDVQAVAAAEKGTERSSQSQSHTMITSRCIGNHGLVPLNGTLLIESIDPTLSTSGHACQMEYAFQLVTKEGKSHIFRAVSKNAYERWVQCISANIVRCQENSYFDLAENIFRATTG